MARQAMNRVLRQRGARATIVGATSGDTGAAAIEAFGGQSADRGVHPLSARAGVGRAAPADDDGRPAERPCDRDRRHVRRLPGASSRRCSAISPSATSWASSGVNSINWARILAQIVYYFTSAVALGAPDRRVSFAVPTGNFGDIFAGYYAKRMGLPIERLIIATNDNDILARALASGLYAAARGQGDAVAVDGHPGLVEFRAPAVRGLRPRRRAVRALMDELASNRASSRSRTARWRAFAPTSTRSASTRRPAPRRCVAFIATSGIVIDPHSAVGVRAAREGARRAIRRRR